MNTRKYGFIAFWKHNDYWYSADHKEKQRFIEHVNNILQAARDKGLYTSNVFDCSWSSEWRYFSFWESPSIELIIETIEEMEKCGDINLYNIQHHFIGIEVYDNENIDIYDSTLFNE